MPFAQINDDMSAEACFAVLLKLAEHYSNAPHVVWGYSAVEIEAARQAMPALTRGLAGPVLPAALARWCGTVGRVRELTASQNNLHAPCNLTLLGDVVIFYTENQGCARWGVRLSDWTCDDPPVVFTEYTFNERIVGDIWLPQADRLSRFALTVGLSELCLSGSRYYCAGHMDDTAIAALRSRLRLLPAAPLRWPCPERDACFLADDDLVILMETDFCFAVALRADIKERISLYAGRGHIDWTE